MLYAHDPLLLTPMFAISPLLLGAIGLLAGRMFGGPRGESAGGVSLEPEMQDILRLQRRRMVEADPLYQAILRLAFGMIPLWSRRGIRPPQI